MVIQLFRHLLILALVLIPATSLAAQLEAVPDRTRVGLEESFELELRASGSVDGEPNLSVLEGDFELLGRSQSSQVQIINTDISRSTTWRLTLLARSAGRKTIPAICIERDCSEPVVIDVLPAGQNSSGTTAKDDLLIEVSAEPTRVWVQSQIIYKVRILTRLNFLQASLSEPEPSGVEAVIQKLGDDRNYDAERNGLRYRVIERNYVIFPQQSGRLTIPAIRFSAQVAEPGQRGFTPFNQRTRQLRRHSQEISIDVLPAPETAGRDWLPANDLSLTDDWQQPPRLTVGEPATRTITLRASGLTAAQLPTIVVETPADVRSYPDQPNREDQVNENGIIGILQQKMALVPTRPGTLLLPEIKIDWWDLQAERWRQAVLPSIKLEVQPAADQPIAVTTPTIVKPQQALTKEQSEAKELKAAETTESPFWYWLSLVLGCGWLLTLLLIAKSKFALSRSKNKHTQNEEASKPKATRREVQQALKAGDSARIRSALLDWGAAQFPKQRPGNLEELAVLCGEPMQQQLEAFSRSLYSHTFQPWDGDELIRAMARVEAEVKMGETHDVLPPLYPR